MKNIPVKDEGVIIGIYNFDKPPAIGEKIRMISFPDGEKVIRLFLIVGIVHNINYMCAGSDEFVHGFELEVTPCSR